MPVINSNPSMENRAVVHYGNWFSGATISGSAGAPGFPPQNLTDPATYNSWRPNDAGVNYVDFDLGQSRSITAFGVAAHNAASNGGGIYLDGSDNGTDYVRIVGTTPSTNEDILFLFPSVSYRYYRVGQTLSKFNIGYANIGNATVFPCTPIDSYTPAHHSKQYTKQFNRSIQGQFLGNRVMGSGGTMSVQFPHVNRNWVDGPLLGFENHYNRGGTFFYAGWPGGKPQDMAYAWPASEDSIIDVEYVTADKLATVSFDMQFYNPT